MKHLLFYIILISLFSSCRVIKLAHRTRVASPYVALNNGDTIRAKKVQGYRGAVHVGKTSYDLNDVAAFTWKHPLGKNTITIVVHEDNKNSLYLHRVTGRMNVYYKSSDEPIYSYKSYDSFTGKMENTWSHPSGSYYVRIGDTGRMVYLSYRNLKNLIPTSEPAYKKLLVNRGQRFAWSMSGVVGLGLVVTGLLIAYQEKLEYNGTSTTPTYTLPNKGLGLMMANAGVPCMTLSIRHFFCYGKNGRAIMAINKYNDTPQK